MNWDQIMQNLVATLLFGVIGILLFVVALAVVNKVTPFSVHKEIGEDQNVALGIVIGSFLLGLAIILATAIEG